MPEFDWPWILLLLPLPLAVRLLLPAKHQSSPAALRVPFFENWISLDKQTPHQARSPSSHKWLLGAIWMLLVIAAAKPQIVDDPLGQPSSGRDLMLAVDISGSMEANDLPLEGKLATRLQVVKHVMNEFIQRREGDRLGLILFGEQAFLQTPLTLDRTTVATMLDEAQIGFAGSSRTAIGDGIGLAIKRLKERPEQNRVLILLTDGQNNTGEVEPLQAAELAAKAGITIYTIGVGADEMLLRSPILGIQRVQKSADLDEATLKQVAQATGGRYFRARSKEELEEIYLLLDQLEPVEGKEQRIRPTRALFIYPMALAFLLMMLPVVKGWWAQSRELSP